MHRSRLSAVILVAVIATAMMPLGSAQRSTTTEIMGGGGGSAFSDSAPEMGSRVLEVRIAAGDHVDSIQLFLELPDGRSLQTPRHGGSGGRVNSFRLDSDEYITGISGRYGEYLDSIRIHTNKRMSPVYGGRGGDRDFRLDVPSGNHCVGLTGRSGDLLDAIGLVYMPLRSVRMNQTEIFGGRGGSEFVDSNPQQGARLVEIRIQAGELVDSIQAVYVLANGRRAEGQRRGGRGGRLNVFRLDSDEYITGISGRCGDFVDSLRIHTNKRTSQLYGGGGGNRDFRVDVPSGTVAVGFAGRAGIYLDAIGLAYSREDDSLRRPRRRRP